MAVVPEAVNILGDCSMDEVKGRRNILSWSVAIMLLLSVVTVTILGLVRQVIRLFMNTSISVSLKVDLAILCLSVKEMNCQ